MGPLRKPATMASAGRLGAALIAASTLAAIPLAAPAAALDGTETILTVAGTDPMQPLATDSRLGPIRAVAAGPDGDVYLSSWDRPLIRRIDADTGQVTVIAGNGEWGDPQAGPALETPLTGAHDLAVADDGDVYLAANRWAVKIDAGTGLLSVVAGDGTDGYNGDGIAATDAQLSYRAGIAVDDDGTVWLADTGNHRVRRVDPTTGVITTVAGTGANSGYSGDGGQATATPLAEPRDVVTVPGALMVVANTHFVYRVDLTTGVLTRHAGADPGGSYNGDNQPATDAQLSQPSSLAADAAGNLWIADETNSRIRRVDATTGEITTVAGTGSIGFNGDNQPATSAGLFYPNSVALDGDGHMYVADQYHDRVRRVEAGTGTITTVAGTGTFTGDGGPATAAQLYSPSGVVADAGANVFVTDSDNHRIRRIDAGTGEITTVAGTGTEGYSGDGGPATAAELDEPVGLTMDPAGNLWFADHDSDTVRRIDAGTGVITTVAGPGSWGFAGAGGPATAAQLNEPAGVAVTAAGLWIADGDNHRIRYVDLTTGDITTVAGTGAEGDGGDGGPATSAQLDTPVAVAVGPDGELYLADLGNDRVRRIDAGTGIITTVAGGGNDSDDGVPATEADLADPSGLAVDGLGNLYVSSRRQVRRVDAGSGIITTVAGTGDEGDSGDGGPAFAAELMAPSGLAFQLGGGLLIADPGANRIRFLTTVDTVDPTIAISLAPGTTTAVRRSAVTVTFSCADLGGSQVASCTATDNGSPLASGHTLPTADVGARTVVVTATDGAGNTATATRTVSVVARPYRPADDQVIRLYRAALGREPDAGGLAYWSGAYRGGATLRAVAAELVASAEFVQRYGAAPTNGQFLDALYLNVLGRPGDDEGRAYWLAQLGAGLDRIGLLLLVSDSPENIDQTLTDPPLTSGQSRVLRMYSAAFGRTPDDAGLAYWSSVHAQGMALAQLAGAFRASAEYVARYGAGTTDGAFVTALYQNILGRAPDPDGLAYWGGLLGQGQSRDRVMVSFAESRENLDLTGTAP